MLCLRLCLFCCVFVVVFELWLLSRLCCSVIFGATTQIEHKVYSFCLHVLSKRFIVESGEERGLDEEYGGRLQDEKDPFQGTGALDLNMATAKKA